ncbi:MAG: rRNA maturation RNase YbeY [Mycoplasmataceae bacterium]|jgi:probable rRNA maturation factor|nr:rRNA maturation RNase YbeY [Mycoplasmataceae bacterium]
MKFTISDPFNFINIKQRKIFKRANICLKKLQPNNYFYDVNITNDKAIKKINFKYRHQNKTTDVLSFAMHENNKIKTPLLGEIFINYQQAQRQANVSNEYELTLLFIHGVLHLLGYDHHNKNAKKRMFDLQNKIIKQLKLVG